jgi:GGDEF domain-containing protein
MIVERFMSVVVRTGLAQLESDAFVDPVTGLGNRHAFEVDLRREAARAARHQRPLTVVRVRGDGVRHAPEGDDDLRGVGAALLGVSGREVHAYRLGWTDFGLILPDVLPVDEAFVAEPLRRAGLGGAAVGVATFPPDPIDALADLAGARVAARDRDAPSMPDSLRR